MKDRVAGAPGQYSATVTGAAFKKMQNGEPFTITLKRDDKPEVEGTPYSKAAVLPDALAEKLCPGVADPTPADALSSLARRTDATKAELGDKEEIFTVAAALLFDGVYAKLSGDGWEETKQDDCKIYNLCEADEKINLAGKTVTIRTYMYGDMAIVDESEPNRFASVTNAEANINQNSESGIFEYEYTFPDATSRVQVIISFCENSYMDRPKITIHNGTVWEEIKNLQSVEGYDSAVVTATAVRYTAQSLTDGQKAQARANIGAVTLAEVLEALPIYNGEVEEV